MRQLFSSSSPLVPLSFLERFHHSSSDKGEREGESDGLLCCIIMIQDAISVNPGMILPLMQARCVYVCMCVGMYQHCGDRVIMILVCCACVLCCPVLE